MTKETRAPKAPWALPDRREIQDRKDLKEIPVKLDLRVQKEPRVREVMLGHRVSPDHRD